MNISNILTEKNILLGLKANSKREFLQELAQRASEITGIDALSIFDAILERENLGSTGLVVAQLYLTAVLSGSIRYMHFLPNLHILSILMQLTTNR